MLRETFSDDFIEFSYSSGFPKDNSSTEVPVEYYPNIKVSIGNQLISTDSSDVTLLSVYTHFTATAESSANVCMVANLLLKPGAYVDISKELLSTDIYITFDLLEVARRMLEYNPIENVVYYGDEQLSITDFLNMGAQFYRVYSSGNVDFVLSTDQTGSTSVKVIAVPFILSSTSEYANGNGEKFKINLSLSNNVRSIPKVNEYNFIRRIAFRIDFNIFFRNAVFSTKFFNDLRQKKLENKINIYLISNYKNGGELYVA